MSGTTRFRSNLRSVLTNTFVLQNPNLVIQAPLSPIWIGFQIACTIPRHPVRLELFVRLVALEPADTMEIHES